jgi:hypothetical protein
MNDNLCNDILNKILLKNGKNLVLRRPKVEDA